MKRRIVIPVVGERHIRYYGLSYCIETNLATHFQARERSGFRRSGSQAASGSSCCIQYYIPPKLMCIVTCLDTNFIKLLVFLPGRMTTSVFARSKSFPFRWVPNIHGEFEIYVSRSDFHDFARQQ